MIVHDRQISGKDFSNEVNLQLSMFGFNWLQKKCYESNLLR
jgi:hypothetical protein